MEQENFYLIGQAKSHSSLQEGTGLLLVLPILVAQKSFFLWPHKGKKRKNSNGRKGSTFQAHIHPSNTMDVHTGLA